MTQFLKYESGNTDNKLNSHIDNPTVTILSQLNKNPHKVFADSILKPQIYTDSNFKDIFNFSLYYYLTSPQIQSVRLKEIYENLKKFIYLNSNENSNTLPIFYFETINKSFNQIKNLMESEIFFILKENLNILEELIPFMQDICAKLSQLSVGMTNSQLESSDKCVKQIHSTFNKLKVLNSNCNNYNKEKINFALAHYKHIDLIGLKSNRNLRNSNLTIQITEMKSSNSIQITNENVTQYKTSFVTNETEVKYLVNNFNNKLGGAICSTQNIQSVSNENNMDNQNNTNQETNYKIISDDLVILKAKTKNYNLNHFTRETFNNKFLKSLNMKECTLHNMLTNVALEYFSKIKREKIDPIIEYIDFSNLKAIFSNYFPGHLIYLIGSVRSSLLYDTKDSPARIDLLLLPNIYTPNQYGSKNVSDHIKVFKNLNGIMDILNSINANRALTHEFLNLDKVEDYQLENFYLNFDLVNKKNKNRSSISTNLIFYDEKLKMSSDINTYVFYKNTKLQALHVFFQEILMNSLKLIATRRDLSVLILSYLNTTYKLNNIKKQRSFYNLSFKGLKDGTLHSSKKVAKNFKNSELVEESFIYWYREFSEDSLKYLNKIELGELIFEFLRYVINYFNYLKNQYNIRINKNFPNCKGFEYLKEQFHDCINQTDESYSLINHLFLVDILYLSKIDYDFVFCKKLNALEEIYFKICENSDKIKTMNQIISNVNITESM